MEGFCCFFCSIELCNALLCHENPGIHESRSVVKKWLRRVIILLVRLYGVVRARAALQRARQVVVEKPRILLVRPDNLGDLLLTTPVLHALKTRAPEAHITMLV